MVLLSLTSKILVGRAGLFHSLNRLLILCTIGRKSSVRMFDNENFSMLYSARIHGWDDTEKVMILCWARRVTPVSNIPETDWSHSYFYIKEH